VGTQDTKKLADSLPHLQVQGSTKMSTPVASAAAGSASSASSDVASLIEKAIAAQEYGVLDTPITIDSLNDRFILYKCI
jgi:hypothetical protein